MKTKYSTKDLFSHLSIFEKLNEKTKLNIFKVSCRNNFRYLHSSNREQRQVLKRILKTRRFQDVTLFEEILEQINNRFNHADLESTNYVRKILEIEGFVQTFQLDKWESSIILNIWLARNGFCPFLHFMFDRWYDISQNNGFLLIPSLVEFSTVYLYRLAPAKRPVGIHGTHLPDGSHNYLFLTGKTEQIEKVPKSLAAEYFINEHEVRVMKILLNSAIKQYLPHLLGYSKITKIITRQYIAGKTGHELLATNFFDKNTEATKDLRVFFSLYKKTMSKLEINLDIHPGNFVWSESKQQWFFIDTGPIPLIGSEYFPLDSFKNYFQKIWIERYQRMKKLPIRSVDLSL